MAKKTTPPAETTPPAQATPPAETVTAEAEAGPSVVAVTIELPVLAEGYGYAPRSPDLSLPHGEAEALRDLQQGLLAAGVTVEGAQVTTSNLAIRWLCQQIHAARAAV